MIKPEKRPAEHNGPMVDCPRCTWAERNDNLKQHILIRSEAARQQARAQFSAVKVRRPRA